MKHALIALCLLTSSALAAPLPPQNIANMVAQSEYVMSRGLCQVANDTKDYGSETILVLLPTGPLRILRNDYNWMRSAGYAKGASGRFLMSERIEQACQADAQSGRCVAARSYWSQAPFVAPR